MADMSGITAALQKKLGLSARSVSRRIAAAQDSTFLPRELAALQLAAENGISIRKLATADELTALREGSSKSTYTIVSSGGSAVNVGSGQAQASTSNAPTKSPRASVRKLKAVPKPHKPVRGRRVFVVHGRNEPLRKALFEFLKALDLQPIEWTVGIKETGLGSPTVKHIIDAMFSKAVAVVVLLTPDDLVLLKPDLQKKSDSAVEKEQVGQARPNVLFEAGMAVSSHPESTVLVQVGNVKPFTDIGGVHITHLDNTPEKRNELITKLRNAGCAVDLSGTEWITDGNFEQETYE